MPAEDLAALHELDSAQSEAWAAERDQAHTPSHDAVHSNGGSAALAQLAVLRRRPLKAVGFMPATCRPCFLGLALLPRIPLICIPGCSSCPLLLAMMHDSTPAPDHLDKIDIGLPSLCPMQISRCVAVTRLWHGFLAASEARSRLTSWHALVL